MSTHENHAMPPRIANDRPGITVRIVAMAVAVFAGALAGLVLYLVLGAL
jgi:hypothetical protein